MPPEKAFEKDLDQNTSEQLEWLEHRFSLFEKFCFPSITNQTCQNFKWIVLFSDITPDPFLEKIRFIKNRFSNFYPVFSSSLESSFSDVKKFIDENFNASDTHLISTRLDNDDALHKSYVSRIQEVFNYQESLIVDTYRGYVLRTERPAIGLSTNRFGPFLSLIEKREGYETVVIKGHREWSNHQHIAIEEPLWLQVVHEKNWLNQFNPDYYLKPFDLNVNFNIEFPLNYSSKTILQYKFLNLFLVTKIKLKNLKKRWQKLKNFPMFYNF